RLLRGPAGQLKYREDVPRTDGARDDYRPRFRGTGGGSRVSRCATEDSVSAGQAKMKTSNLILTALALNACLAGSARSQQVNETGFVQTIAKNTASRKLAPEEIV